MCRIRCSTQVSMTASGHVASIDAGEPFEAVADDDADIVDATVLDLDEHLQR